MCSDRACILRPGDVFICNDPWLAAGHGYDVAVVTPFFRGTRLVGFTGSIANVSDIGGVLNDNLAREAYEEGLLIPMAHLFQAGQPNDLVLDFLRWNVRVPDMVIGDVYAEAAANEVGAANDPTSGWRAFFARVDDDAYLLLATHHAAATVAQFLDICRNDQGTAE